MLEEEERQRLVGSRWSAVGVVWCCVLGDDDVVLIWNPALVWVGVVLPK